MSSKLTHLVPLCLVLAAATVARGVTVTVGTDADTYVSDATPHGDAAFVFLHNTQNAVAYLRFDLSDLNILTVQSATLTVAVSGGAPRNDNLVAGRFVLHGLDNVAGNTTQDWGEMTLSSENVGAEWSTNAGEPLINTTNLDGTVAGITETVENVAGLDYWVAGSRIVTVTGDSLVQFIQSRVDDGGLVTLLVEFPGGGSARGFGLASKEFEDETLRPRLELEVVVGARTAAIKPSPEDGATDVSRDTALTWEPGAFAATHNVYFSASFDDVNSASADALVSQGQTASTYEPAGSLAYGQTYYWRIDEVNGAPDFTVYDGVVWSFTVEPLSYPLANVMASASIPSDATKGPENLVNASGLNEAGQHSTTDTDMWLGDAVAGDPAWVQFDFDGLYKLHEMHIWNYNMSYEFVLGFGVKDVTIEYAADANDWTTLGDFEIAQGTSLADYTGMVLDLGGIAARRVRMNIHNNRGGSTQYGLSEVAFSYIPVYAREPVPASGATDVDPSVVLGWRAGREAASHQVYFDTDPNAVADGTTLLDTATTNTYDLGTLDLGTTYYWKIAEVNEAETPTTWISEVWSFSTPESIVVEDFETYTDDEGNHIYETWTDGYGVPTNGSVVGHDNAPYAERTTVFGGRQSMPFYYGEDGATVSEATRTFDTPQDWTAAGVQTLVLYFRGNLTNAAGQLYLKVNGTRLDFPGSAASLAAPLWKQWNIDLTALGNAAANVRTVTLGISGSGAGLLYVDDVRLYKAAPAPAEPAADPGAASLAALYAMEDSLNDGSGNNRNGTAEIGASFGDGPTGYGKALTLDGVSGYATVPVGTLVASLNSATFAAWVNYAGAGGNWQRIFDFGTGTDVYTFLTPSGAGGLRFAITTAAGGGESVMTAPSALATGWHHVAVTIEAASGEMLLYLDGAVVTSSTTDTLPSALGNTTQNWLGRSQYTADPYFNGSIDDFRIYSRALSAGEVRYLVGDR